MFDSSTLLLKLRAWCLWFALNTVIFWFCVTSQTISSWYYHHSYKTARTAGIWPELGPLAKCLCLLSLVLKLFLHIGFHSLRWRSSETCCNGFWEGTVVWMHHFLIIWGAQILSLITAFWDISCKLTSRSLIVLISQTQVEVALAAAEGDLNVAVEILMSQQVLLFGCY